MSEEDSATCRNWSDLPGNVLIHVLEHVDALHRHSSCVLVCNSWAGAAASVRSWHFPPGTTYDQFRDWLAAQPPSCPATSLHFTLSRAAAAKGQSGDPWTNRQLPQLRDLQLPYLQDLQLIGPKLDTSSTTSSNDDTAYLQIQLGASDSAPGILQAAAAGLSRLVLDNVVLPRHSADSAARCADLQEVTVLTSLQHLELGSIQVGPDPEDNLLSDCSVPGAIFPALSHLTHLNMHHGVRSGDTLQHISCLQRLQQLKLGLLVPISSAAAAHDLSGLSALQALTALTIFGAWFPLSTASTPSLTSLTSLLRLHLHSLAGVEPALLRSFPKLQTLQLKGGLLPDTARHAVPDSVPQADRRPPAAGRTLGGTAAGKAAEGGAVAALLSALAQLEDLIQLSLPGILEHPAPTVAAYSALTASSSLRKLDLARANIAAEAWKHIFACERALPLLTQLCLTGVDTGLMAVGCIAQACPGLQQLKLMGNTSEASALVIAPRSTSSRWSHASSSCCCSCRRSDDSSSGIAAGSSRSCSDGCSSDQYCSCGGCMCLPALLVPLQGLSRLTALSLDGPAVELGLAVAQLTQLREVTLRGHSNSVTALEWLLPLKALQQLLLCNVPSHNLKILSKAPPTSPHDVWYQLEQYCYASSSSRSSGSGGGSGSVTAASPQPSTSVGGRGEHSVFIFVGALDCGCIPAEDSGSNSLLDDTSASVCRDQSKK